MITAGHDPLRDEGAAYVNALSDPILIARFFRMLGVIDEIRAACDRAGAELRAALGT